jgi:putative FmdB family regulatory protein
MPIYEYKCQNCGKHVEKMQKASDPPPGACEDCGGAMEKQVSRSGFQFKGSGWYVTDYAGKGKEGKSGGASGKTGEKGTEKSSEKSSEGESTAKADGASKETSGEKKTESVKSAETKSND